MSLPPRQVHRLRRWDVPGLRRSARQSTITCDCRLTKGVCLLFESWGGEARRGEEAEGVFDEPWVGMVMVGNHGEGRPISELGFEVVR